MTAKPMTTTKTAGRTVSKTAGRTVSKTADRTVTKTGNTLVTAGSASAEYRQAVTRATVGGGIHP
jgi:hypothetical protein